MSPHRLIEGAAFEPEAIALLIRAYEAAVTRVGKGQPLVVLETLALSVYNHDTAIASAAARMVSAADGRPLIEMGSRRTHERAAVAAARAAYIAGFAGSSNLAAQQAYGVPALGTSAHAFTLLHAGTKRDGTPAERASEAERAAFRAQIDSLGVGTTLLVDTYDITAGVANAVAVAGTRLGGVRIDSGAFHRLPGRLQQQPLLRVDRRGLARGQPEERGVEIGRVVQETAAARVGAAGAGRIRVVEPVDVPAPVGGEVTDRVGTLGHQPGQVLR